jgi:hypothetical protein
MEPTSHRLPILIAASAFCSNNPPTESMATLPEIDKSIAKPSCEFAKP